MCPVRNVTYVSGRSALTGFGWQATDVDRRRVSPEAPQERREAGAHVAPFAFLMRPFGIELANEGIEAVLLLQAVEARRPGSFLFESEVQALGPSGILSLDPAVQGQCQQRADGAGQQVGSG